MHCVHFGLLEKSETATNERQRDVSDHTPLGCCSAVRVWEMRGNKRPPLLTVAGVRRKLQHIRPPLHPTIPRRLRHRNHRRNHRHRKGVTSSEAWNSIRYFLRNSCYLITIYAAFVQYLKEKTQGSLFQAAGADPQCCCCATVWVSMYPILVKPALLLRVLNYSHDVSLMGFFFFFFFFFSVHASPQQ
jgi:hypothetical protein